MIPTTTAESAPASHRYFKRAFAKPLLKTLWFPLLALLLSEILAMIPYGWQLRWLGPYFMVAYPAAIRAVLTVPGSDDASITVSVPSLGKLRKDQPRGFCGLGAGIRPARGATHMANREEPFARSRRDPREIRA